MMLNDRLKKRTCRAGAVTVELALTGSLLFLMMAGAADFARVFPYAIAVANASGTGSRFGSQNNARAVSHDGIHDTAEDDVADLRGATTITSEVYCDCPGAGGGTTVDCIEGTCADYGKPRVYSKTIVSYTYDAVLPWPGIPDPVVVTRQTLIRVQ